jgi:hypothetical protein
MPRDKKKYHRATSDVEEEDQISGEEGEAQDDKSLESSLNEAERQKVLKEIILKRTLLLKQQRDRQKMMHKQ